MRIDSPTALQPAASTDTSVALGARLRSETRGEVMFDAASRGRYATDASIYQVVPVGVFVPVDDADVRIAIQIARELKVPVLPRGAGTSQCGQTVGAGLVIDCSKHLRNVLALDTRRGTARDGHGIALDHVVTLVRRAAQQRVANSAAHHVHVVLAFEGAWPAETVDHVHGAHLRGWLPS